MDSTKHLQIIIDGKHYNSGDEFYMLELFYLLVDDPMAELLATTHAGYLRSMAKEAREKAGVIELVEKGDVLMKYERSVNSVTDNEGSATSKVCFIRNG